jgi:hypothetical protein
MSGGYFDYQQYRLHDMAESICEVLNEPPGPDDYVWSDKTRKVFKNAIYALEIAEIYMQRIDWLLSSDDSEETFHKRLKADFREYEQRR